MDSADKKELRRLWGRGLAYKELLGLGLSQRDYNALVEAYMRRGFTLGWNHRWKMWYVLGIGGLGCRTMTHKSGNLEAFLDVDAEIARFVERGLEVKDK